MRPFYLLILLISLVSCGSSAVVDYDKSADFSTLESYDYYPGIQSGLNPFDTRRMMRAIDSVMEVRGLSKSINPDLLVNFYTEEYITESNTTIGVGIGGGSGNVGYGVSGGIPVGGNEIRQLVTIDVIDVRKDALIWQGVISANIKENASPDDKEVYFQQIISKLLKEYPPPDQN